MPKQRGSGELVQGTLDMLILRMLARGSMHGYAIAVAIESRSEDVLRVEEGSLYPALHRLELGGMLTSEWHISETNRRAKYYKLTAEGRKQLAKEEQSWERVVAGIGHLLTFAPK